MRNNNEKELAAKIALLKLQFVGQVA